MPANGPHTLTAFDEDMNELRARVASVGGWAEAALREAMGAVLRMDREAAESAADRTKIVGTLADDAERRAICLIALRAPCADDLREVLTCLKTIGYVEGIAAHARNIAAAAPDLDTARAVDTALPLGRLARVTLDAIRTALDGFAAQDPLLGASLPEASHSAQRLYEILIEAAVARMRCDPRSIPAVTSLLFVGRGLVRAADQAANIARAVQSGAPSGRAPAEEREPDLVWAVA